MLRLHSRAMQPAADSRGLQKTLEFEIFNCRTTNMNNENSRTIRALDIGYGLIKFTRSHLRADSSLDFGSFPTYAEIAFSEMCAPTRFTVTAERVRFCMGPESITFSRAMALQFLESSFFDSTHCIALAIGAIASMKIPRDGVVDVLAVGLPIGVMGSESAVKTLEVRLLGDHEIPNLDADGYRRITIRKIKFFGQQDAGSQALQTANKVIGVTPHQNNLYIDVGYVNLSWLIKSEQKAVGTKSNSIIGGVTDLMEVMLQEMHPSAFKDLRIRKSLDDAMNRNIPCIMVGGQQFEIAKYLPILEARVSENVSQILANLVRVKKIGKVYMSGGGAWIYHRKIVEVFPEQTIVAPHSMSHFDTTRGLQMLAEMQN